MELWGLREVWEADKEVHERKASGELLGGTVWMRM